MKQTAAHKSKSKRSGCIKPVLLLCAACAVIWIVTLFVGYRLPAKDVYDKHLKILTYNTHRMGEFKKPDKNRVLLYLQRQNADILCLQEVEVYKDKQYLTLPELKEALKEYPYTYFDFSVYNNRRQYGNAVFSRYPLINKETIHYPSRANISSRCDIVINEDTLRLIVNHLESNRLERLDSTLLEKLDTARVVRHVQAKTLRAERKRSIYPLIIVGDFNDMPLSYTYLTIRGNMRDCFLECNLGKIGNTFVKHHLGVRIDYILCSKSLHPLECYPERVNYSDHYPLIATIGW